MPFVPLLVPELPKTATLTDDFATKDTAKWTWGASATQASGLARFPANSYGTGSSIVAANRYSLSSSEIRFELPAVPSTKTADGPFFLLELFNGASQAPATGFLRVQYYTTAAGGAGEWSAIYNNGTTVTPAVRAHSANTRWWRVRHDGSTVYWEHSPDGSTWTLLTSVAASTIGLDFGSFGVAFRAGADAANTGTFDLDNVNSAASTAAAGSASLTLTAAGSAVASSAGTAAVALSASGSAAAPSSGTATLSLTATGTAGGAPVAATGSASLALAASGAGQAVTSATAALSITGAGAGRATAAATAALTLTASGAAAASGGTITWAGRQWYRRDSGGAAENPGPNYWSSQNATVDANGVLTLRIGQVNGVWCSGEIFSAQVGFGYGRYRFTFTADINGWGHLPVLGFFTYDGNSTEPGKHEIDLEYTTFGSTTERSRSWYTVQPGQTDVTTAKHVMPDGTNTYVGEFIWQAGQTYHRTLDTDGNVLGEHTITTGVPTPGNEQVLLNFWLMNGTAPADGIARTVTVSDFEFTPGVTYTRPAAADYRLTFDTTRGLDFAAPQGSVAGGELVIPAAPGYPTVRTGSVMNLLGSSATIDVAEVTAVGNGTTESAWRLAADNSNFVMAEFVNGAMLLRHRVAGVDSDSYITYPGERYWRISESGGTVTWATSADGSTWTTRRTATPGLGSLLGRVRAEWLAGYYGTEPAPGQFRIRELNPVPAAAAAGTATLALAASSSARGDGAATANLSLTATGAAETRGTGTASLSLTASGSAAVPSTGAASVALSASGPAHTVAAGSASLAITATGTAEEQGQPGRAFGLLLGLTRSVEPEPIPEVTGTAALTFTATGGARAAAAGTAALGLVAAGAAAASTSGAATISLAATGAAVARETGTATLTLAASGNAGAPGQAAGSASLALSASGTARGTAAGSAALNLTANATARATSAGAAAVTLTASGTASARATGTAALVLTATGAAQAFTPSATGTANLTLTATGAGRAAASGAAALSLTASGTGRAPVMGAAVLTIEATVALAAQAHATAMLQLAAIGAAYVDSEAFRALDPRASVLPNRSAAEVAPNRAAAGTVLNLAASAVASNQSAAAVEPNLIGALV